jgi:hypothetical protein
MKSVLFGFGRNWSLADAGAMATESLHYSVVTPFADAEPAVVGITTATGLTWLGSFNRGDREVPGPTDGVYSTPSPDHLLVVASYAGYFVSAEDPHAWLALNFPVVDLVPAYDDRLIVLADRHRVHAIGPRGLAWTTARLSYGGIELGEAAHGQLEGLAWDAAVGDRIAFRINLSDGVHEGGAAPDEQPVWVNPNARRRGPRSSDS